MIFNLQKHKQKIALITRQGEPISYEELVFRIEVFSSNLDREKSIVLCIVDNSHDFVVAYLSFLNSGVVPILLSPKLSKSEIESYIQNYKPKYLWVPKSSCFSHPQYVELYQNDDALFFVSKTYQCVLINKKLTILATTSGSTASKKLVRQSLKNIETNAYAIAKALKIDSHLSTITTLPLNYSFGQSIIHSHFLAGATISLTNHSIIEKKFWELVKEFKIGIIYGVPVTFDIIKNLNINKLKLPDLKAFAQAGGKINPITRDYFQEYCKTKNKDFFIMYGQAEATTRISSFNLIEKPEKFQSVGKPLTNCRVQMSKKFIKPNESELIFNGSNVCMGYANCIEDLSLGDEWNGELKTGDTGFVDNDGYVYITGRLKRIIKIYGHSISLDQLEENLNTATRKKIACIQKNDNLIVFAQDTTKNDIISSIILKLTGLRSSEFTIVELTSLPYTDTGKISYQSLEEIIT